MLSSVFIAQTVQAVGEALRSAGVASDPIAVLHQPRLGRALAERGQPVVQVADSIKSMRRITGDRVCGQLDALPLADAGLAGIVAQGVGQNDRWGVLLGEWCRAVRDGGIIVLIDRVAATELTRRALCGGLAEVEQRQVGRTTVTSGRVRKLD